MKNAAELHQKSITEILSTKAAASLLRISTAGSVDDGKSTLIGRLLHDSKSLFEDHLSKLERTRNSKHLDFAALTDGLRAEQEQGITIDVAYRYFSTPKRTFILADTPGHEQYTRNMATGASTADVAIILIDARQGVMPQTRRHTWIASLLGIQHILVAVNKMDLVKWDQNKYDQICQSYTEISDKLNFRRVDTIPLSALHGENVVNKSSNTPWYKGPTLLDILEKSEQNEDNHDQFRFPIQYVIRPHQDFRGFAGTIISGEVCVGDEIQALPSNKTSKVRSIETFNGQLSKAFAGQAVTITLSNEIDISRGSMLTHNFNKPTEAKYIESMVVWMDHNKLREGQYLTLKHTSRNIKVIVKKIDWLIEIETLKRVQATTLKLNDIAKVKLECADPIYVDPYHQNRINGAFILIDPINNATAAAGMIEEAYADDQHTENSKPAIYFLGEKKICSDHINRIQEKIRANGLSSIQIDSELLCSLDLGQWKKVFETIVYSNLSVIITSGTFWKSTESWAKAKNIKVLYY
ncbi:MAG: sulfate adenylyltransferase subunit CysN [Zetaproteobacteria bacterium]|nr:sulfate adenylyltransferase subunit CysN [Pseudobdellovibrionaceae bacterium]